MKLQRENLQPLFIYAFIGVMAACVAGYFLYQNRQSYWNTQARDTFRQALMEEVQGRNVKVPVYTGGDRDLSFADANERRKEPITVSIVSEYGKKNFVIPYEKHVHNIERPSSRRLLAKIGYSGRTIVRISAADWWRDETYAYSANSPHLVKPDSLATFYLGYRCEIGVAGYLCRSWW
jgi:hypothetical protein